MILGFFVSNNASVLIMMGIVKGISQTMGQDLKKCVLLLIYASNISFATPFSYQTNMMVMPPGKYIFIDYVRFGVPLQVLLMLVVLGTATLLDSWNVFPFTNDSQSA